VPTKPAPPVISTGESGLPPSHNASPRPVNSARAASAAIRRNLALEPAREFLDPFIEAMAGLIAEHCLGLADIGKQWRIVADPALMGDLGRDLDGERPRQSVGECRARCRIGRCRY